MASHDDLTGGVEALREPASRGTCPRCGPGSPIEADGSCQRCRSLVAARTLPLANASIDRIRVSQAGFVLEEEATGGALGRADPLIGIVVADRYRIVEPLGRGGMGIVYKVEHIRIGKLLAMKLLAGELSRNHDVVRRFKHEALTASKLSSPNTVQVFDFGVSEGQGLTYLVMELVTGDDLGKLLKVHGSLPAPRLGRIVIQVGNSLAEAHAHGIVHRDIKPENVMILAARDSSDIAKVLDFGLAKLREGPELSEMTSAGAIVGTPYFMSPEQVRGDPVDHRSDIYSLGALMYRALTGHYPFTGPSPMSVFAKHLTEAPRAPHEVNASVTPGMSEIVLRALRKDPSERFQRIEDLQAAVVTQLAEMGTSGIETLFDSGALRRLERAPAVAEAKEVPAIATRDEVESYERKLRRARFGITALLVAVPLAAIGAGGHYLLKDRPVAFGGEEIEPNNTAAEANAVPWNVGVSGMLGKRIAHNQSDVDFYAIDVPRRDTPSSLRVSALPNLAMCVQIFRKGDKVPTAQYCPGYPGLDLEIRAVLLEPGSYLVAVMQDLDARRKGATPFVYENVSDTYSLTLGPAEPDPAFEIEPNESASSATPVGLEQTVSGILGWVSDTDVVCAKVDSTSMFRYRVEDEVREGGVVLSASLLSSGAEGPPVRVHVRRPKTTTDADVQAPFTGFTFRGHQAPCLVLRAVLDPSATEVADATPRGSRAKYKVTLEPVP